MDSKYKAWQLAVLLHLWFREHNIVDGLIESAVKHSEPFDRYGDDQRTQSKYFELMLKYGYVKINADKRCNDEPLFIVPENIRDMKPKSIGEEIKAAEARLNGQPVTEQKTLKGEQA